jgi:hypothetical protein
MDTAMANLPSEVGTILRENIAVIKIMSMSSIGAYNAFKTVLITFGNCPKLPRSVFLEHAGRIVGHSHACSSCYGLLLNPRN